MTNTTDIQIGDGATASFWSDRHAFTVVAVSKTGHTVKLQRDRAIRTDGNGMSDAQTYRFERDPDGTILTATRRENGRYKLKGYHRRDRGGQVTFGFRGEHFDYSFMDLDALDRWITSPQYAEDEVEMFCHTPGCSLRGEAQEVTMFREYGAWYLSERDEDGCPECGGHWHEKAPRR